MRRAYLAIAGIFAINGVLLASWVARIPSVSRDLALNNAQVGIALLGVAVGSLSAFPFVGRFIARYGSARVTIACGLASCVAVILPAVAPHLLALFAGLVVLGASVGAMDVAMNAQGVEVERTGTRAILNALHGFWSIGGFVGATMGGWMAGMGVSVAVHLTTIAFATALVLLVVQRFLVPDVRSDDEVEAPVFMLPPRALWGLGAIAFCAAIGEGAIADWSALYLNESLGTSVGVAASGYAVFSLAMVVGRFSGDALVARMGAASVVRTGGAIAAVGLAAGLAVHTLTASLIGFAVVGLGLSVIVPTAFSAAGRHPTIPRGTAIAAVATVGYAGLLAGPPTLGWVAELTSLRIALALVVIACAIIVVLSPAAARSTT